MLGDDGILFLHVTSDPLRGTPCPFIDTYATYIMRGEHRQLSDDYARWMASSYNLGNTIGLFCYDTVRPDSRMIDLLLSINARMVYWPSDGTWFKWAYHLKPDEIDLMNREYFPKLKAISPKPAEDRSDSPTTPKVSTLLQSPQFQIGNEFIRVTYDAVAGAWGISGLKKGDGHILGNTVSVNFSKVQVRACENCRREAEREDGSDGLGRYTRLKVTHRGLPHVAELVWSATVRPGMPYADRPRHRPTGARRARPSPKDRIWSAVAAEIVWHSARRRPTGCASATAARKAARAYRRSSTRPKPSSPRRPPWPSTIRRRAKRCFWAGPPGSRRIRASNCRQARPEGLTFDRRRLRFLLRPFARNVATEPLLIGFSSGSPGRLGAIRQGGAGGQSSALAQRIP